MRPVKFTSVVISALLAGTIAAQASGHRPDTRTMSCGQAKSLVQQYGAIVMSTGNFTYDKFVKNHAYCNVNQELRRAFVPTADYRRCKVGFICKEKIFD